MELAVSSCSVLTWESLRESERSLEMEDWTRNQDKQVTEYAERTYINVTTFQGEYFPPISYQRGSEESNVQRYA